MKKKLFFIKTNIITRGALAIALIFVYFSLFKGVTNIINAFLVPLTLCVFTMKSKKKEIFIVYLAAILFSLLLFPIQSFFIVFYCGIAFLLLQIHKKNVCNALAILLLTITVSLSFWIAILLTDRVFLMNINGIMMQIFKGNIFAYTFILVFEGAIVGTGQLFLSKSFYKRIARSIESIAENHSDFEK